LKIVISIILVFACIKINAQKDSLIIGVNPSAPPFGYKLSNSDSIHGVDADIAHRLGEFLKRPVKVCKVLGADRRKSGLDSAGKFDFIVAIYSVTEERKKTIVFSKPYHEIPNKTAILFRNKSGIDSVKKLSGKKIGVINESISDTYLKNTLEPVLDDEPTVTRAQNQEDLIREFNEREYDVIIDDYELQILRQRLDSSKLSILKDAPFSGKDFYAIAINQRNQGLLDSVNLFVESLEEDFVETQISEHTKKIFESKKKKNGWFLLFIISLPLIPLIFYLVSRFSSRNGHRPVFGSQSLDFAWLIAIDKYDSSQFDSFGTIGRDDCQKMTKILSKSYGFNPQNIVTSPNATRATILNGFEEIKGNLSKSKKLFGRALTKNDRLFIYFSGHGVKNRTNSYWVPRNARKDDFSTYIKDIVIGEFLEKALPGNIFLVSDSCFSNYLVESKENVKASFRNSGYCGISILTSGYDKVPAISPFTQAIIDNLELNSQGVIDSFEIFQNVKSALHKRAHYLPQWSLKKKYGEFSRYTFELRGEKPEPPIELPTDDKPDEKPHDSAVSLSRELCLLISESNNKTLKIDALKEKSSLSLVELNKCLTDLENKGLVKVTNGIVFKKPIFDNEWETRMGI